jgi:hypothetical protein
VTASDVLSLVLTTVFGIVSTVGVVYQVIDIRRRHPAAVRVAIVPRAITQVRVLLLILTVLAIPTSALWVSAAVAGSSDSLSDPFTWAAAVVVFLVLSIPLAVAPTVLSVYIGRGRAWARGTAIAVLAPQGLCCTVYGLAFPIGVAVDVAKGTTSGVLNVSLGLSLAVLGIVALAAVVILLMPSTSDYFRANMGGRSGAVGP